MFKKFGYEGYFYCKKCDSEDYVSGVKIIVDAKVEFEEENGSLRKPSVIEIKKNTKVILKCDCGIEEEITDKVKIEEIKDDNWYYYDSFYIRFKED